MTVELHPAYFWDCDHCGAENWLRAVEGNLDEAAFMAMVENDQVAVHDFTAEPGCEQDETGYAETRVLTTRVTLMPKHVTCEKCGTTNEVEMPEEPGGDE